MSISTCTFWVGENLIGLRLEDVHEIAGHLEPAIVPLAPVTVGGLINLRGEVVPTIDARRCLRLPERPSKKESANIILRRNPRISLTVDEIGDIITLDSAKLSPPPNHIQGVMRFLVEAVARHENRLVLLVPADGFVSIAQKEAIQPTGDDR